MSEISTSGGSSDTGQNALTVVPTSSRPSAMVTSVTPEAHADSALASWAPDVRAAGESPKLRSVN